MERRFQLKIQNGAEITTLSYKKWYNEYQIPKATIVLVHGISDHINRYNSIANTLVSNGYATYGLDLREHGENKNISINGNFSIHVHDLDSLIKQTITDYPKNKIVLIGQGIGSQIIQRYCELYPDSISGAILCGTKYTSRFKLYIMKLLFITLRKFKSDEYQNKYLSNLIQGCSNKKIKSVRTEFDWINHNEAEVDAYINDRFCGNTNILKLLTLKSIIDLQIEIKNNFKLIDKNLKFFIINGEKDSVNNFGKFSKKIKKKLLKLKINNVKDKIYKDARHEIFLDNCKEEVYSDILSWITTL